MTHEIYTNVLRKLSESIRDNDPVGQQIFQLATPRYSVEVMVEEDATSLKVWANSTGEPVIALGWPYADDLAEDAHLIDVIAELGSLIQLARFEQHPSKRH